MAEEVQLMICVRVESTNYEVRRAKERCEGGAKCEPGLVSSSLSVPAMICIRT
jgi:hypothetical protein